MKAPTSVVGRGTTTPFELVGAPWIDSTSLAAALNALDTGARFVPVDFVPSESSWHGRLCHSVRIVRDPNAAESRVGRLGLALAVALHALYPTRFDVSATRDVIGSSAVWQALREGAGLDQIDTIVTQESTGFAPLRETYVRY
ncbi:exo-beta-N-acetylmuramidase NamZ domain-containing protein [Paraburkholderia aromaticivorans]|uniref:exo-beta-N-acetylmuramidase NamZ domain-containing protein n=1 Tax=Paraburkholderia aromaticivorans TaxID=2026199 RepID=UPI0014560416|nr:exo-beta-N-acetylmuramidase NamZ domain-containing protein [Paraburkholderia aromaticivorans]